MDDIQSTAVKLAPTTCQTLVYFSAYAILSGVTFLLSVDSNGDACFNTDHKWNMAICFSVSLVILASINIKRKFLADQGGYNTVALLQGCDQKSVMAFITKFGMPVFTNEHRLRTLALLIHLCCIGFGIELFVASPKEIKCESKTVEAFTYMLFVAYLFNFAAEITMAFCAPVKQVDFDSIENEKYVELSYVSHTATSIFTAATTACALYRMHDIHSGTDPFNAVGSTAIAVCIVFGILATTSLSSDYLVKARLISKRFLKAQRGAWVSILILFVMSVVATGFSFAVEEKEGKPNSDDHQWAVAQVVVSLLALVTGPIYSRYSGPIQYPESAEGYQLVDGKLVGPKYDPNTLRPAGGMQTNRLTEGEPGGKSLQFV